MDEVTNGEKGIQNRSLEYRDNFGYQELEPIRSIDEPLEKFRHIGVTN